MSGFDADMARLMKEWDAPPRKPLLVDEQAPGEGTARQLSHSLRTTDYRPPNLTPEFIERVKALVSVPPAYSYDPGTLTGDRGATTSVISG